MTVHINITKNPKIFWHITKQNVEVLYSIRNQDAVYSAEAHSISVAQN
jgi:hypothetical protein